MKTAPLQALASGADIARLLNLDDLNGSALAEVITDYFGDRGSMADVDLL